MQTEVIENSVNRMMKECDDLLQELSGASVDVRVRDLIERHNWSFDIQVSANQIKSRKKKRIAKLLVSLHKALNGGRMTQEQENHFRLLVQSAAGKDSSLMQSFHTPT